MKPQDRTYALRSNVAYAIHRNRHQMHAAIVDRHLAFLGALEIFQQTPVDADRDHDWSPHLELLSAHLRDNSIARGHAVSDHVVEVYGADSGIMGLQINELIGNMLGYLQMSTADLALIGLLTGDDYMYDEQVASAEQNAINHRRAPNDANKGSVNVMVRVDTGEMSVAVPLGGGLRLTKKLVIGLPDVPETITTDAAGKKLSGYVSHPMLDAHDLVITEWQADIITYDAGGTRPVFRVVRDFGQGEKTAI